MSAYKDFMKSTKEYLIEKSPTILTGIGIAGMCGAIVQGIAATPKAMQKMEVLKEELGLKPEEKLTVKEIAQSTWTCYIPCAVTAVVSAGCIIASDRVHNKRNVALMTAYSLTEKTLTTYKDKVTEVLGDEKAKEIQKDVERETLIKTETNQSPMMMIGDGTFPCMDSEFGVYFESTYEDIMRSINAVNRALNLENYISVNDFYYELGIPQNGTGDRVGWNVEDGLLDVHFTTSIYKNRPCMVMNYDKAPKENFRNLH